MNPDPPSWTPPLLDADDVCDEAIAQLVDLLHALGDQLASSYAHRIERYYRARRDNRLPPPPPTDIRQLDLFSDELLEPF